LGKSYFITLSTIANPVQNMTSKYHIRKRNLSQFPRNLLGVNSKSRIPPYNKCYPLITSAYRLQALKFYTQKLDIKLLGHPKYPDASTKPFGLTSIWETKLKYASIKALSGRY
jgi:hypothetical protein